jgi:hypothetical protein
MSWMALLKPSAQALEMRCVVEPALLVAAWHFHDALDGIKTAAHRVSAARYLRSAGSFVPRT